MYLANTDGTIGEMNLPATVVTYYMAIFAWIAIFLYDFILRKVANGDLWILTTLNGLLLGLAP